jgi:diacylglycerol O-acyltransferase
MRRAAVAGAATLAAVAVGTPRLLRLGATEAEARHGIKRRVERATESGQPRAGVDRLTGQDLSNLSADAAGWSQDIGVIAILDGAGLTDADGRLRIDLARAAVAGRLDLVPRLRQVVCRPGAGFGGPFWADAEAFDLAYHVRVRALATPADDAALLEACESLRRTPLDWSRPLWQLWLLPGLSGGRVGIFFRLHHVVADGVAGVALIGALLDAAPAGLLTPSAAGWVPRPVPTKAELIADTVRRRGRAVRAAARVLAHPVRAARRAAHPRFAVAGVLGVAPRTSLNRPIGADRRIAVIRGDLRSVADAAHGRHATVNDVILAAVAGGLRHLLRGRGEATDGLVLRAAVPVSLHREAREHARGNVDGGMTVPLPVGEADPFTRLQLIAEATAVLKSQATTQVFTGVLASSAIQKLALLFMTRQRLVNVYVANVPGPPAALHLGPARLSEAFAVVPLLGNVTLGVGVLSYAGQLNITVVADRDSCPDLPVFTEALRSALAELTAGATGTDSLPDLERPAAARTPR